MKTVRKIKQKIPLKINPESDSKKSFLQRVNSFGGIAILFCTLIGLGYKAGSYYEEVKKQKEISELINRNLLEIIEIKEKYNNEIFELKNQINLLNIKYEKENEKSKQ